MEGIRISTVAKEGAVRERGYVLLVTAIVLLAANGAAADPIDDIATLVRCNLSIDDFVLGPPDPGAPGPFGVVTAQYDYGDQVFVAPGYATAIEERAEVTYPDDLACGPFPILFVMHGKHNTCMISPDLEDSKQEWPCPRGYQPLPSFEGYRWTAELLASHGFIVVSISANGTNVSNVGDKMARAHLFHRHMEIWQGFHQVGAPPFGQLFKGRVDLQRVGLLGHSRGGEGAMLHDIVNQAAGNPFGVRGIMTIGATRGTGTIVTEIPVGIVLPYCDGDVTDLDSIGYYDEARYASSGDAAPKHTFEVVGANHANFNLIWDPAEYVPDAEDDWVNGWGDNDPFCELGEPQSGRLTGDEQRAAGATIAGAFFRTYLKAANFHAFLRGDDPPPPSAQTDEIYIGYHPPDLPDVRRDLNRVEDVGDLSTSTLGGSVAASNLSRYEYCDWNIQYCIWDNLAFAAGSRTPHDYNSEVGQIRVAWRGPGRIVHALPAGARDLTPYEVLQFRTFVDPTDPLNPLATAQDFRIELTDGFGSTASTTVAAHSPVLFFPPSSDHPLDADSAVPRAILNTARVPLSAFTGVLLTDVRHVRFVFDQTPSGAINLADIAFAD